MLGIYVRLANSFGAKNLIALKILFCPREGRSMLSPPALGSSRRQGSANDPSGGRRSSQEGLWGRLSSQEAIGGLSRQSLFGGLSALASSRHLGSPEGNGGRSRRTSIENVGMSPGGKAPPLGAAAKRASFFTPDLPRYACIFIPYTPVPTLYRNSPCMYIESSLKGVVFSFLCHACSRRPDNPGKVQLHACNLTNAFSGV